MLRSIIVYPSSLALALIVASFGLSARAQAQTYQIDCAILLCLSGGWPASVPCTRARAEFIRRLTPWPVEPPLQIWRCPMGASYQTDSSDNNSEKLFNIQSSKQIKPIPQLRQITRASATRKLKKSPRVTNAIVKKTSSGSNNLYLAQQRANIDIRGPEFNFVRSIRVFNVRYAYQSLSGREGDCHHSANVIVGTYGPQGSFSWARSSLAALPTAHAGLEGWGTACSRIYHRSVFVEWRDYMGRYGFEQINY